MTCFLMVLKRTVYCIEFYYLYVCRRLGVEGEYLTPEQCQEKAPLISVDGIEV